MFGARAGLAVLVLSFAACGDNADLAGSSEAPFRSELELRDATSTVKTDFAKGEPIEMVLRVRNVDDAPHKLTLPTSQVYDFAASGSFAPGLAWHWSHDRMFATVVTEVTFDAGETKEFSVVWDQADDTGAAMPTGSFEATGLVVSGEPGLQATRRFTIH